MNLRLWMRGIWRELRGTWVRVSFFALCLTVGVAAVFVINAIARSMDQAVRAEARDALAADIAIIGRLPLPEEAGRIIEEAGAIEQTRITRTAALVSRRALGLFQGRSTLVSLNIVDGRYPLAGSFRVVAADRGRDLDAVLDAQSIVVTPELLRRMQVRPGDTIVLAGSTFRIAGVAVQDAMHPATVFAPGPRAFISAEGLERTRFEPTLFYEAEHRTLLLMPEHYTAAAIQRAAAQLRRGLEPLTTVSVESYIDGQPVLREGIERFTTFLGLVAMLSLVVGGVGVAQAVRAWIAGRSGAIGVLKCLGMRPLDVLAIYVGQLLLIAGVSALAGLAVGYAILSATPQLLDGVLPQRWISPWQPIAAAEAFMMGIGVALAFSLPPLLSLLSVPPAVVLRREAEPLRVSKWLHLAAWTLMTLLLVTVAAWQGRSMLIGLIFVAGLLTVLMIFAGMTWLLTRAVGRIARSGARFGLRYAMANVARPGGQTYSALVSVGLGVLVVLGLTLIERGMSAQLDEALPRQAPSAWLLNIPAERWPALDRLLQREGALRTEAAPVILGRLVSINGISTQTLFAENPGDRSRQWALTRNQRLSYAQTLPDSNRLTAGSWWDDSDTPQISIERNFASDIEVGVGDTLVVELAGTPVSFVVSSLRDVDWRSFELNFMMLVNRPAIEGINYQLIATAHLPAGEEQRVQDAVAAAFPGVLFIQTRAVLDQVGAVLQQLGRALRMLGLFVVAAGLAILGAAVSATTVRRSGEVALLKTLGMTRPGVIAVFSIEYVLLALVAFAVGAAGAMTMSWVVLVKVMDLQAVWSPVYPAGAMVLTVALMLIAGLVAGLPALRARPHRVLQNRFA